MNPKKDHIYLVVNDSSYENVRSKRKIWRWWNQLSRLQRSLFYISLTGLTLCCFLVLYFIPNNSSETLPINVNVENENVKSNIMVSRKKMPIKSGVKFPIQNDVQVPIVPKVIEENNVIQPPLPISEVTKIYFKGPTNPRQQAVVNAFKHAWKGYKTYAWGFDNLKPISASGHNWFNLGLTIIDSLDTLYIMNLQEEYQEARKWVDEHLNFDKNGDVNLFEVTIRILGGLLSIYHLTGDELYLNKARDLGDRLLPCFQSPSGIPYSDVNLQTHEPHAPKWSPDSSTSEVTTIQLEFRDLSRATGNSTYENAVSKVSLLVHNLEKTDGLVPIFINANTGNFRSYATITLGARGDSYYEYLLKQWIQTGKKIDYLIEDYERAITGVMNLLVKKTAPNNLLFIGELISMAKDFKPKMDHLTCYLPGTLALGVHNGMPQSHMQLADDLLNTCVKMYSMQPTYLAPEIVYFNIQKDATTDMYVKTNDAHNLLRPELIESLWYMYQLKKENYTIYQDWGWKIFQAFETYTKVANGYTSIGNVRHKNNTRPKDMMESFFLGETLKYLYLLFSDDRKEIDLDKFVLNSEAHPLPIYNS